MATFPAEFVAERLLNLYKALEVVFGRSADTVRDAARAFGAPDDIAEQLAALVYVRDSIDVGHPALTPLARNEFIAVHRFASRVEDAVTWMLAELVERVAAGTYTLRKVDHGKARDKTIAKIVAFGDTLVRPFEKDVFGPPRKQ